MHLSGIRRYLAAFASILLIGLGGCSLLPIADEPPALFVLSPKNTFDEDMEYVNKQLLIEVPIAAEGLNSHRIALSRGQLSLDYFAKVRWTERAPLMIQTLLVESFENTRRIVSVAREGTDLRADYALKTELREFQAEYTDEATTPNVHVRMIAKVIKMPQRIIVASSSFEAIMPAGDTGIEAIVATFDEALGKVLKRIVVWAMPIVEK